MNTFVALADDTRREIVMLVARKGEISATDISLNFSMSHPAISQHLKILKEANLLVMKKDSQRRMYSLNKEGIDEMQDWISEIKNLWVKRLDRMNKYVMKLKKERASNNA